MSLLRAKIYCDGLGTKLGKRDSRLEDKSPNNGLDSSLKPKGMVRKMTANEYLLSRERTVEHRVEALAQSNGSSALRRY